MIEWKQTLEDLEKVPDVAYQDNPERIRYDMGSRKPYCDLE